MNTVNPLNILHTEEIKKRYSGVEREIKRRLTEILLLNNISLKDNTCRGLSITKNFKIRRLSANENSKFLANPSTIKSPVIGLTADKVRSDLFNLIDHNISDSIIAERYKSGIDDFFMDLRHENVSTWHNIIRNSPEGDAHKFMNYMRQCRETSNVKKMNIKMQLAKILYSKFGEDAFSEKMGKKNITSLSEKSLNYIYTIFYNANKVWESRGKSIDKVFHDGDFPFITENIRVGENDYIDVLVYLVDKSKSIFYGKRGSEGQAQWSRKKSQYADILWALTNDQLKIHDLTGEFVDDPNFHRDTTTQNLSNIGGGLLENIVATHNNYLSQENRKLKLSKRLKSLSSSTEKIVEGRKINDVIGFRLSMRGISEQNFDDIKNISKIWLEMFKANLQTFPNKYVKEGQTISIKDVCIDNKGVLDENKMAEIIVELNKIVPTRMRKRANSPYIQPGEREKRIQTHYPEIMQDDEKWAIIQEFYKRISGGKRRGNNGGYKDFKFNITFEVKDKNGNPIGENSMEVQFDDINNGKGLANYNIRNFERWLNTQSRLSFSVPLSEARKNCEKNLKKMYQRAKTWTETGLTREEKQKFFEIPFEDGSVVNISQFRKRDDNNSKNMDNAIIKIINYFLEKGTFILCDANKNQGGNNFDINNGCLTINDLHDKEKMENIHICSSLELASQQHSYLQQNRDRHVGIYLPERHKIGWVSVGELIDPMNLGKIKDKKYSANI